MLAHLSLQPLRPGLGSARAPIPARAQSKGGAPRTYGNRLVLDAISFVLRSGCPWRMAPRDPLPWDAACRWYRT